MRTICILCLIISVFLSSAVMADRPAMQNALGGLLANSTTDAAKCGNPETQRINVPIPIALGRFFQPVRIFPVVKIEGGDAKDQIRADAALKSELQKVAFRCNFTVASGIKAPVGSMTFTLTLVKDHGQSNSTSNRSDSESWGGSSNRHGSSSRSETGSSFTGGESTFVAVDASGELVLNEADGSTTSLASVSNVFSANSERTGSAYQDSTSRHYDSSSRRWGSDHSDHSSSNGSTFRSDPEFSKSQSSRITIPETAKIAVDCGLEIGISNYNFTHAPKKTQAPALAVEQPKAVADSGYTGDPAYIAEDE